MGPVTPLRAFIDHTSSQITGVALAFDTLELEGGQERTQTRLCLLTFDRTGHKERARVFVRGVFTNAWKTPLEALEALSQLEKAAGSTRGIPLWWAVALLKA